MRSLATLIKLQKARVDEQRIMLAKLQEQLEKAEKDLQALRDQMEAQKKLLRKNPDMSLTYGAYLKEALKREELLEKRRKTAEYAVSIARDKLAEVFEEQKRYELAEAKRLEDEAKEEAHKETLFMDEVGSVSFVRKKRRK